MSDYRTYDHSQEKVSKEVLGRISPKIQQGWVNVVNRHKNKNGEVNYERSLSISNVNTPDSVR